MSSDSEYILGLEANVMQEWRRRSRNVLYQTDPVAWLYDILGKRWWSMQEEVAWSFEQNEFTIVKSANGVGKTQLAGDLTTWFVSVFPPNETTAMVSAPVRNQIDENLFGYLRSNMYVAAQRDMPLIGEITRWPKWIIHEPYDHDLVLPKRPADQNLLSAFQGVHRDHVAVILDEAGGLQEDFFLGANAVTTNDHARILAIGNPDMRNTAFHERFKTEGQADFQADHTPTNEEIDSGEFYYDEATDRFMQVGDKHRHWHRFTIKTRDLPSHTGEVVYEDPEEQEKFIKRLTKPGWTAMMERSASKGVIAAKVNGEFPDEDDNTFFSQLVINKSWETWSFLKAIKDAGEQPYSVKKILGVDVAFSGADKNVIRLNEGGLITLIDKWGAEEGEEMVSDGAIARRIHRWAHDLNVSEVRVDAAGTSRGVHSFLKSEAEFFDRRYVLIGINGSHASGDIRKWRNARAWHYDQMRLGMANGTIGLDPNDTELRTDLEVQTYDYTLTRQLVITPKDKLKSELKRSPDDLDAAIYSIIDFSAIVDSETAGLEPGDTVVVDPWDEVETLMGMPI